MVWLPKEGRKAESQSLFDRISPFLSLFEFIFVPDKKKRRKMAVIHSSFPSIKHAFSCESKVVFIDNQFKGSFQS